MPVVHSIFRHSIPSAQLIITVYFLNSPSTERHDKGTPPDGHIVNLWNANNSKAIIIGGGPAGICAALRLNQTTDITCAVYEIRPEPATIGSAVGIFPNGMRLFDRLGVHDKMLKHGASQSIMSMYSLKGKLLGQEDVVRTVKKRIGYGYLRIKRAKLLDILLEAAEDAQIPVHYGKRIVSIHETDDSVMATFDDGSVDTADFLLGCDGIHSSVRRLYVDESQEPEYSGFSGLGSIIPTANLNASVLPKLTGINATFTEHGVLGILTTLQDKSEILWFVSRQLPIPETGDNRDGWEVSRKKEVEGFKESVMEIIGDAQGEWGDAIRNIVDKTESVQFYPIFRLPKGGVWHKGRCLLLGDAAHAMTPHAGQGVSMALEDVFALCKILQDKSRSLEESFVAFENVRRPRVEQVAEVAEANGSARKDSGPMTLWLKEVVLSAYFVFSRLTGIQWLSKDQLLTYDAEAAAS